MVGDEANLSRHRVGLMQEMEKEGEGALIFDDTGPSKGDSRREAAFGDAEEGGGEASHPCN
jgi:hypothetical protein